MRIFHFILVSIIIGTPFHALSQKYANKEMSLISFNVSIHPDTKKYLDQFESHFSSVKNTDADKIIAKVKEQVWGAMVDSLQQEIGMILLPISTFGNKIGYDAYNFPDVSISKAQRIGFSRFYMKVELEIGPKVLQYPLSHKERNDSTLQSEKPKEGEEKPVVTITITCYPTNGIIPIGKYIGSSEASNIWKPGNTAVLDGLVNSNNKNDLTTLMSLVNEAIFDLIINMQIK